MNDLDPSQAASADDLARCLRQLHTRADSPSYRTLEDRTKHQNGFLPGTKIERVPLRRTKLGEVLQGKLFPRKAFLLTLVEACGIDLETDRRWEQAWDRLAEDRDRDHETATGHLHDQLEELRRQLAAMEQRAVAAERRANQERESVASYQFDVGHLGADYAYVSVPADYELSHFEEAYAKAAATTEGFTKVAVDELAAAIQAEPIVLLVLRVITGLSRNEFADSTKIVGEALKLRPLRASQVRSMETRGAATTQGQARVAAETFDRIMRKALFGEPPGKFRSKQDKPDTEDGWESVRRYASQGVPYGVFLHQRHYGGSFRQVLDATSDTRGYLIEDAVEALFAEHGISYIRADAHNQAEIAERFKVTVTPAPDFVVYDANGTLRALLECKSASDSGTARDKALRFERLHDESVRLGGVPLIAVLSGFGWTGVNGPLESILRDCDGRVFSVSNLDEMLTVAPFPALRQDKK